jgi:26S proteasome regulatory subunit N10
VLVTLTSDIGKLLSSMHGIKLGGKLNFTQAIQVAQVSG